ncbi:MAG: hypothetical protein AW07_03082 [Candidatus Accumulibacter sp. SK-11]|nr:MAG: hypothetical protein AW07_03082 [Candidatus Accumulibacter sp. SK-11]
MTVSLRTLSRAALALLDGEPRFEDSGYRRCRIHWHAYRTVPAASWRQRCRHRQSQRLLRRSPQALAPRPTRRAGRFPLRRPRHHRSTSNGRPFRSRGLRSRHPSRRTGGCPLLVGESRRLRGQQSRRLPDGARRLSPPWRPTPRLCLEFQRLWRQRAHALCRAGPCRSPGQSLRGDQEGQRADGAHVQPSLPSSHHRSPLLHRLRAVGTPRHGSLPVHPRDHRGAANRRLQSRGHAARLYLHRRHCCRRRAGQRSTAIGGRELRPRASRCGDQQRPVPGVQHRQPRARATAGVHRPSRAAARSSG